ncbi:MAG: DUF3098 domain-containing protein [Flavobacteriales bacterium]|nr:DUF3098 domain-containing protein [Flavobacteriales bacterium]
MSSKKNKQKDAVSKTNLHQLKFAFSKENYKWMLIGLAIITLGFVLMAGNTDDVYNGTKLFDGTISFSSTIKITIAPLVVLAGFAVEVYAIFKKSDLDNTNEPD